MEENRLSHNVPTWNPTKPASNSLESSNNNTTSQACKHCANTKENEESNGKVIIEDEEVVVEETGREKLKRHREEVKGQVDIPENWGQEKLLKDWINYTTFDALLAPHRLIVTARDALIADGRKARSQRLRIDSW